MWGAIERFRAELFRRMVVYKTDKTATFPPKVLMIDELGMFAEASRKHWRQIRENGQPALPPVWDSIGDCLMAGRQFNCFLVLVTQDVRDTALPKGFRNLCGLLGLAGFNAQQWKRLVGTSPVPRSQTPRGRWIYTNGQADTWVQNVYGEPQEIRDWADRRLMSVSTPGVDPGHGAPTDTVTDTEPPADVWIVGVDAGQLTWV